MQHMSPFSPFHHLLCMYMRCYVYIVHFNSKTMHIISMKRAGERERVMTAYALYKGTWIESIFDTFEHYLESHGEKREKRKKACQPAYTHNSFLRFILQDDHVLKQQCALNVEILSGMNHTRTTPKLSSSFFPLWNKQAKKAATTTTERHLRICCKCDRTSVCTKKTEKR